MTFKANIVWIKSDFGGLTQPPTIGLRPMIRFQRHIREWLVEAFDVQIVGIDLDPMTWSGTAQLRFTCETGPNPSWLKQGELFELLAGDNVIGVGKVLELEGKTQNGGASPPSPSDKT